MTRTNHLLVLIDDTANSTLLLEYLNDMNFQEQLVTFNTFNEAKAFIRRHANIPKTIIIGSGILIHDSPGALMELKSDIHPNLLSVIVLLEFQDEHRYLIRDCSQDVRFFVRPFHTNQWPELLIEINNSFTTKNIHMAERNNSDV